MIAFDTRSYAVCRRSAGILVSVGILFLVALLFTPKHPGRLPTTPPSFQMIPILAPERAASPVPARRTASRSIRPRHQADRALVPPAASAGTAAAPTAAEEFDEATAFSMALAVADARRTDKVLRGGGPPLPKDHPIPRFEAFGRAVAAAVAADAEPPMGPRTRYVDASGAVYTAITEYGRTTCFVSAPTSRPDGKSRGPRKITCPESSSSWRKHH